MPLSLNDSWPSRPARQQQQTQVRRGRTPMDEGQMNRIETRAVFLHPALASRPETEKIASKHKTRFVARKIAKLMFHSITQLADSATNLPSPNDERKSQSRRRGREGKRVPLTQTPLISVPPSFFANFEQRRYYKNEFVGVSLLGKPCSEKSRRGQDRNSTQHVSCNIITGAWPPSSPPVPIVLNRDSTVLAQSSFRSSHPFESPQTSP